MFSQRISNCIINIPSAAYSGVENCKWKAASSLDNDLAKGKVIAVVSNISGISSILPLLQTSSPSAIFRFISGIIVNAFYCHIFSGSRSHIEKKSPEITPFCANRYPSTSISSIGFWVAIFVASIQNTTPYSIFRSFASGMCCFGNLPVAPTRSGHPAPEILASNCCDRSTVTATNPTSISINALDRNIYHAQSTVSVASKIFYSVVSKRHQRFFHSQNLSHSAIGYQ